MLQIRTAAPADYERVRDFYYFLTDAMQDAQYPPGWEKDVYPTQEFLQQSIRNGELYLGESEGRLLSCMVTNHQYNAGYRAAQWSVAASDSELLVIHALGVHPPMPVGGLPSRWSGRSLTWPAAAASKPFGWTCSRAISRGAGLSEMGFTCRDTMQLYYADTGWTAFKLFEYVL